MMPAALLIHLAVTTAMVALTVATHPIGLTLLLWLLRRHRVLLRQSHAVLHDAGVILLGWSTALFVTIVGRMRFVERELEDRPR